MGLFKSVILIGHNPFKPIEKPIDKRLNYKNGAFELNRDAILTESFKSEIYISQPSGTDIFRHDYYKLVWICGFQLRRLKCS